jgi:hypothetical protein
VGVIVWWLDLQLFMQSVPITTDVVSSNLDKGEVYNLACSRHYVTIAKIKIYIQTHGFGFCLVCDFIKQSLTFETRCLCLFVCLFVYGV